MGNPHRGDVVARLGGVERTLRLTLGALAELEAALGAEDLGDLARRFAQGKLRAGDAIRVIAAGLRGGGTPVTDDEVAAMAADGGVAGFVDIVVRLIAAAFGAPAGDGASAGEGAGRPFDRPPPSPGTT